MIPLEYCLGAWAILVAVMWCSILWPRVPPGAVQAFRHIDPPKIFVVDAERPQSIAMLHGVFRCAFVSLHPKLLTGELFTSDEVRMVVLHELAHHAMNHPAKRAAWLSLLSLPGFLILAGLEWWFWPGCLGLWYLGMGKIAGPIWKRHEFEADKLATGGDDEDRQHLLRALLKATNDPTRSSVFHPSLAQRADALGFDVKVFAVEEDSNQADA